VFGYYIEVTDAHRAKVPTAWSRKQTVKNAERYITEELKKFEDEALGAQDKAIALEQSLFEQIRQALLPHVATFQELAHGIARVDVLSGQQSGVRRTPTFFINGIRYDGELEYEPMLAAIQQAGRGER